MFLTIIFFHNRRNILCINYYNASVQYYYNIQITRVDAGRQVHFVPSKSRYKQGTRLDDAL